MEKKVALLVIYNHRFDKNIPLIDKIYEGRFSNVFHIVPFYDGNADNVIPVYASSLFFQSYISQAYTHLKLQKFTHFFIVADDMLLNPKVNEKTLWIETGLMEDECMYPSEFWILQDMPHFWSWYNNVLHYNPKIRGVEIGNILPSKSEAEQFFRFHGIPTSKIPLRSIYQPPIKSLLLYRPRLPFSRKLKYPLVAGYSDIFMITADVMDKFCQYCGAFAATNLFVEAAIPTSLILSAKKIRKDNSLKLHCGAIWGVKEVELFNKRYNYSLSALISDFPSDKLFIHPIKLSKWK